MVMDGKNIVRAGYNAKGTEYLATRTEDSEDVQLLQELVQRLPTGAKVLDAGCGAGVPVTKFLSRFFEVTGVDFAEAQIQLARQLVPQAQFVCQDMTELAFPDQSFDAICSYYAIIHIPRQEHRRMFLNLHRILRPLGLALLCLGASDLADDIDENYLGARMYWSHYDADTNIEMLHECGFNVIWSKIVADSTYPGSAHLFVLAQIS
jgi:ubiquinone/menaquinone biosynthesis C-methylase UbiE